MSLIKCTFDRCLTLDDGEIIVLKFDNEQEFNRTRVSFFAERSKYYETMKKSGLPCKSVNVSQITRPKQNYWALELSTDSDNVLWFATAVIKTKGGDKRPLDLNTSAEEVDRYNKLKGE